MVIDNAQYPEYRSEIYQIDPEGHSAPITRLGAAYSNNNVDIESLNWSPDGSKIAFTYFLNDMMTNEHFAVVDVGTGQTIDYCLPSVGLLPPIWSPDSLQVAFASATTADLEKAVYWRTIIVDIEKEYAVQVAETMLPLGWMIAP
jgi:Tol biopolymer transport system component